MILTNNDRTTKRYRWVIFFLWMSGSACAQHVQIKSEQIEINYDTNFNRDIQWLGAADSSSLTYFNPNVQPGIIVNGVACYPFIINKTLLKQNMVNHKEFGSCIETVITGFYRNNGLSIERQTKVLLPKGFGNVAIFKTTYRNLGKKKIYVDSVYSQRIALKSPEKGLKKEHYTFASFQGGVEQWGNDYSLIWLPPGFKQNNFQGMHHIVADDEVVGGGMPFIDIWGKSMGVALAHLETKPQWLSLPVKAQADSTVEAGIVEASDSSIGIDGWLEPNATYNTVLNAIIFHKLDFYDALHTYGNLLRKRGIDIQKTSSESAYDPYWKSWGFDLDFTLEEIYGILPELKSFGITTANLDDGWFNYYGDWEFDRSPGKFPNGEADMITFVNKVHQMGFKTNLWWYPLGVSPESVLAKEHPDLLIMNSEGDFPLESRKLYQLCPAYEPAMEHIRKLVERFTVQWGYDGLYSDTRGLSAVPPCFNAKHKHKTPLESFQEVPKVFEVINSTLKKNNKQAIHEVCICAAPHSPYNMPYYQVASASDPINLLQTRRRVKVEKGIHGPTFAVGDCYQVPDDEWSGFSVPQAFESAIGTGAQATTFYTDLDSAQHLHWNRWFKEYNNLDLSSAEYINLYDLAYDSPEIHVIKKEKELFYGVFADLWSKTNEIELRGLEKGLNYTVYDYANKRHLGSVNGNFPFLKVGFRDYLLIQLTPE